MSESYIPPDFDRQGPEGQLIDMESGLPIGEVDYYGGWQRGPDGAAYRDFPGMPRPPIWLTRRSQADSFLLLLAN